MTGHEISNEVHIESTSDHVYAIQLRAAGDLVDITLHADPTTVARIGIEGADERRLVEETTDYLIHRQRADDLPTDFELADVAAAYDGWIEEMHSRFVRSTPAAVDQTGP